MRKTNMSNAEIAALKAAVPDAIAAVKKELVKRLKAAGHKVTKDFDVDGVHIWIQFDAFGLPGYDRRRWSADTRKDGGPRVQVTMDRHSGNVLRRRMKDDGSFPYDEFVERVKWNIEADAKNKDFEAKRIRNFEEVKALLTEVHSLNLHLPSWNRPRDFGQGCTGELAKNGDLEFKIRLPQGTDPERIGRVINYLKFEFPVEPEGSE